MLACWGFAGCDDEFRWDLFVVNVCGCDFMYWLVFLVNGSCLFRAYSFAVLAVWAGCGVRGWVLFWRDLFVGLMLFYLWVVIAVLMLLPSGFVCHYTCWGFFLIGLVCGGFLCLCRCFVGLCSVDVCGFEF